MSVALFLDVNRTLTKGSIQERYAELIGCETEYAEIEAAHQANRLSPALIGAEIIALFSKHGFSERLASEYVSEVPLQEWTEELLALPVAIFLVSSGPDYFIRQFADRHGIPQDHVLCSEYTFELDAGKAVSCKPVGDNTKASFVQRHARRFLVTVGVGDSPLKDGPFVSRCTFPILTEATSEFFALSNFEVLYNFVRDLSEALPLPHATPRLFIGSSTEAIDVANSLQMLLEPVSEATVWPQIFAPSDTTIESLEDAARDSDFAVFIANPDDTVISRGSEYHSPRDNVVFELGIFLGALGRRRCFIIAPTDEGTALPRGLAGVTYLQYRADRHNGNDYRSSLGGPAMQIRNRILELGPRTYLDSR